MSNKRMMENIGILLHSCGGISPVGVERDIGRIH